MSNVFSALIISEMFFLQPKKNRQSLSLYSEVTEPFPKNDHLYIVTVRRNAQPNRPSLWYLVSKQFLVTNHSYENMLPLSLFIKELWQFLLPPLAVNIFIPKSLEYIMVNFGFKALIVQCFADITSCIPKSKLLLVCKFLFPRKVFIVCSVIFVKVQQVFCQSFHGWEVLHTNKRAWWNHISTVIIFGKYNRHWIPL